MVNGKKVRITTLEKKKSAGEKIVMLTAYDYPTARILDEAGIDAILVGDSLGPAILGYETEIPVTLNDMIHHCKAVSRGAQHAFLIGDMPFMSYKISSEQALRNCAKVVQKGGVEAVKLEGGAEIGKTVVAVVNAGIPVMGHIGFTPQSVHQIGGPRIQGRTETSRARLLDDAKMLEESGVFALVLEAMLPDIATEITEALTIPTIGIGAGIACDGQVLVLADILNLFFGKTPRLAKQYADLKGQITKAVVAFMEEVKSGKFPDKEHTYET